MTENGYARSAEISARIATTADSDAIAIIYNQGIEDRTATFETTLRTGDDIRRWFDNSLPIVVAELDGNLVAFAGAFPYSSRKSYSGIVEFSVYVKREMRGKGAGKAVMKLLIEECRASGIWKLVSRVFIENESSRSLLRSLGFREVGIYEKHGKLDGKWKDTVIVEYLIRENLV